MDFLHHERKVVACSAVAAALLTNVAQAHADDVDTMLAHLEEMSRETSALNEQVKDVEDKLGEANERVAHAEETSRAAEESAKEVEAKAANAQRLIDAAHDASTAVQTEVNDIAGARYRGALNDSLRAAMGASDPNAMIDRVNYVGLLSRDASDSLLARKQHLYDAAAAADQANAELAAAKFHHAMAEHSREDEQKARDDLEREKGELERRQAELSSRMDEMRAAVESMGGDALRRWQEKDGPVAPLIDPAMAQGVVASALSKQGAPYAWGSAGPDAFDCSGLMVWSYAQNGKSIPRTSQAQIAGGTPVSKADLQPGDIVGFYPGITHVAMYIGNGQVIHASDYGIPVQVVALDSMPFMGAARY